MAVKEEFWVEVFLLFFSRGEGCSSSWVYAGLQALGRIQGLLHLFFLNKFLYFYIFLRNGELIMKPTLGRHIAPACDYLKGLKHN